MKAYIGIRDLPHYRRDSFAEGLKAAGHDVKIWPPPAYTADTVYVSWNRYAQHHEICNRVENAGGLTIVAENPYLGMRDECGYPSGYALSLRGHNGSGEWFPAGASRLDALPVDLQPWQYNADGHVLVCGQRGIGSPSMASPPGWHDAAAKRLAAVTRRRIVIRPHPEGGNRSKTTLAHDMVGAWAVVIWSSASGVQALVAGIPVFYDAPHWVCDKAAQHGVADIERPWRNDANRLAGLREMAWAQWTLDEIRAGLPFVHLLGKST